MPGAASIARYDGLADWYDSKIESATYRQRVLRDHLAPGTGLCLDIGYGTGRDLPVIAEFGWTPVGVELSSDQLRVARGRATHLVQGDAERLPFRTGAFAMAVSSWTSTDVEHFDVMLVEATRVLRPGGRFLLYGAHPCFNGPHVESGPEQSRVVHATYREAKRHVSSPWWGIEGIRTQTGGMRHVPLADFLNAFLNAGLRIGRVIEPGDEPVPHSIVVSATTPS